MINDIIVKFVFRFLILRRVEFPEFLVNVARFHPESCVHFHPDIYGISGTIWGAVILNFNFNLKTNTMPRVLTLLADLLTDLVRGKYRLQGWSFLTWGGAWGPGSQAGVRGEGLPGRVCEALAAEGEEGFRESVWPGW